MYIVCIRISVETNSDFEIRIVTSLAIEYLVYNTNSIKYGMLQLLHKKLAM